ncbi:MAG: proprotein convertase P-domain-containing protein, partial [Chitinophagales bacterium]
MLLLFQSFTNITAQNCSCTNCPIILPDNQTESVVANLVVETTNNNSLGVNNFLEQVCLNINHTWLGDLSLSLTAPSGVSVVLFDDGNNATGCPCGNSSDDMEVCFTLNGQSTDGIFGGGNVANCSNIDYLDPCNGNNDNGEPCYFGMWEPWEASCGSGLDQINTSGSVSGIWTLTINDHVPANQGMLLDFSLVFATPPDACQSSVDCNVTTGTFTSSTGSSQISLCTDESFTILSNGDYELPYPSAGEVSELVYAIYNCQPTNPNPSSDPCFSGVFWGNENIDETSPLSLNVNGVPNLPATVTPSNNTLWYVPITADDGNDGLNPNSAINYDFNLDGCYVLGTPVQVTYADPISVITLANNCDLNTENGNVVVSIFGGLAGLNGGTYSLQNLGAGTIPSNISIAAGGQASVTIDNLNADDAFSFLVTDNFGCSYLYEGSEFSCSLVGTLCNIDATLTATPPTSDFENGRYPPNQTVTFCYNINRYEKIDCNYLQGIVPFWGNCWQETVGTEPTVTVTLQNVGLVPSTINPAIGVSSGSWNWYDDGIMTYNNLADGSLPANTPVGAGWFFNTSYDSHMLEYGTPNPDPSDPSYSYGDGDAMEIDDCDPAGNGFTWEICFQLTTKDTGECLGNTDCTVGVKSYSDGEVGVWNNSGCTADSPVSISGAMCCLPDLESQTLTACAGEEAILDPAFAENGTIYWYGNAVGGLSQGIGATFTTPPLPYPGPLIYYMELHRGNCVGERFPFTVTVEASYTAEISGGGYVCDGETIDLQIDLTGPAPWEVVYAIDGIDQAPITITAAQNPYTLTAPAPTNSESLYTLTSVGSANTSDCQGFASGSAIVRRSPPPTASALGSGTICDNGEETVEILLELKGVGPWLIEYEVDGQSFSLVAPYTPYPVTTDLEGTYIITSVSDSVCEGTPDNDNPPTVTLLPTPNAGTDTEYDICNTQGTINLIDVLEGNPDAGGVWTTFSGVPYSGTFTPTINVSGLYNYTVDNGFCEATASIIVNIITGPDVGEDTTIDICETDAPFSLFDQIDGTPDIGGTWTDENGNVVVDTFNPLNDNAGDYFYTITTPECTVSSTLTINNIALPNAGNDNIVSICEDAPASNLFNQIGGTPDSGGSFTDENGNPFGFNFNPIIHNSGVYTYTVNNGNCSASATVTINITTVPNTGQNTNIDICENDAPFSLTQSLNGNPDLNGTWTDENGNTIADSFNPNTQAAGNYTYTIDNNVCVNSTILTISLTASPNAGTDSSFEICDTDASFDLINELNGSPENGGIWTDSNGNAVSSTFNPQNDVADTFTYTVSNGNCSNSSTLTVDIVATPNAGQSVGATFCVSDLPINLIDYLGNSPQNGGTWTAPNGNAFGDIFTPSTDQSGIYTYTIINGICNATAFVDIALLPLPNAGQAAIHDICPTELPFNMQVFLSGTPENGGIWTDENGNTVNEVFDINAQTAGVFTYTVGITPCSSNSTLTINVNNDLDAGENTAISVCQNDTPFNLTQQLNGTPQNNGSWTDNNGNAVADSFNPATQNAGIYTYTIVDGNCLASTTLDISIVAQFNAGTPTEITVCENENSFLLFEMLEGSPDENGVWTDENGNVVTNSFNPNTDAVGIYTYTHGSGICSTSNTLTIAIDALPNIGLDTNYDICANDASFNLIDVLEGSPDTNGMWTDENGNVVTDSFNPTTDASQIFTYSLSNGVCDASAALNINVVTTNNAGEDNNISVCDNDASFNLIDFLNGTAANTGTWTDENGNPFSNTFDPTNDASGIYTYTVSAGNCSAMAALTIDVQTSPNAGENATMTVCTSDSPFNLIDFLNGTPQNGGSWTDENGNAISDIFNPASQNAGNYIYTISSNNCENSAILNISVESLPNAGNDSSIDICESENPFNLLDFLDGNPQSSGSWTDENGNAVSDIFNPASQNAGDYTYTLAFGTCSSSAILSINIDALPNAGNDATHAVCENENPFNLLDFLGGTPEQNGTWLNPSGNPTDAIFVPSISPAGVYVYTVQNGLCSQTALLTINVFSLPNAGTITTIDICDSENPFSLTSVLNGNPEQNGFWTDENENPIADIFNPASQNSESFIYTINNGLCQTQNFLNITVLNTPNTGTNTTVDICETAAAFNLIDFLGNSPDQNGTWQAPNGNIFDSEFTPGQDAAGNYVYSIDNNGCSSSTILSINVSAAANAGTDNNISVCESEVDFNLIDFLNGNPQSGGSWTDENGNIVSDIFSPATQNSGNYIYTIENNICSSFATLNININNLPTATLNGSVDICNGETATLDFELTGTPPFTLIYSDGTTNFTLNNLNNSHNETVSPTQNTSYEIVSVTDINGCFNDNITGNATINVNDSPTLSNIEAICLANNTEYTITAIINNGSGNYSISPASAGTINGNTFTSNPIASDTAYSFEIADENNCEIAFLNGSFNCDCATNSGTMSQTLLEACEDENITVISDGNSNNDGNDVFAYILHDGNGTVLGTVFQTNTSGIFAYDNSFDLNTTYYVSFVLGNNDGNGNVDLNDPCLSVAQGTPIIFYENPIPNAGNDTAACGTTFALSGISSIGTGIWTYSPPTASATATFANANDAQTTVTVSEIGTYSFTFTETNGLCENSASVNITFDTPSIVDFPNDAEICSNETLNLSASIQDNNSLLESVEWLDENGQTLGNTTDITISETVNGCEAAVFVYTFNVFCNGEVAETQSVNITVFPTPQNLTQANSCSLEMLDNCTTGNLVIEYDTDGDGIFTDTPNQNPISGETIEWQAFVNGSNCVANGTVIASCTGCPTVTNLADENETFCDIATPDFEAAENTITIDDPNTQFVEFQWFSDNTLNNQIDINTYEATHSGSCEAENITLFAGLICDSDQTPIFAGTINITIFPTPQNLTQANSCSLEML